MFVRMEFDRQQRALLFIRMHRPDEALKLTLAALATDPHDHYAYYLAGHAHYVSGRWQQGLDCVQRAIGIDPNVVAYHVLLADILSFGGNIEAALATITHAAGIDPENVDAHVTRGIVFMRANRLDEAEAALGAALELDPGHVRALQLGSINAGALRNDQVADHRIRSALHEDPNNARSLIVLAWNGFMNGAPGDHVAAFKHALSRDPSDRLARLGLRQALSWFPRVLAWSNRLANRARRQDPDWILAVQVIAMVTFVAGIVAWAYSGFDRALAVGFFLLVLLVGTIPIAMLPALLQWPSLFSPSIKALYSFGERMRFHFANVFFASALLMVAGMGAFGNVALPLGMLCVVGGICCLRMDRSLLAWRKAVPWILGIVGGGMLFQVVVPPASDDRDVLAGFGLGVIFLAFALHQLLNQR